MAKLDMTERIKEVMYHSDMIRNIAIIAHIHHGKTTLTDNLVAGAGMIASELAGEAMFTWIDEQERQRELTIYGANVSMVHTYDEKDYLINLMDTPGHVDFGGDVTRAVRSVDGAIVVVDAVEGTMPQTEIVLRQALKERVKPIIFINKTDRLIKELKLTPEQMLDRFEKILANVNVLIQKYAEEESLKKWGLPNVQDGSVAFGSAYHNWAISIPFMKKTGITFKDIIELTNANDNDGLKAKAPMYKVVLDMVVRHLPNPVDSQRYRVPKIWKGDLESQIAKDMLSCNINGKPVAMITKMFPDPHTGFVACARILSGKLTKGQEVYLVGQHKTERIQLVTIYKGIQRIPVDEVVAGNIAGLVGLQDAFSGETICDPLDIIEPFEELKHLFEPVVTKAIEPESTKDLSKLIDFLRQLHREDPTIQVKINQETGEYLVSGLGELHLDAKVERKLRENNIPIKSTPPIVVYRESCGADAGEVDGKSPNKHNLFVFEISPLNAATIEAMRNRDIVDSEMKRKDVDLIKKFDELGFEKNEARSIKLIYNKNIFIDGTKGTQYLNEAMELVKEGFKSIMDEGPLSKEPCIGLKVVIKDATLHEDAVHRGPAQVLPAVRFAIKDGILKGDPFLMEPKQIIRIDTPKEQMGGAIREIQNRRGQILDMVEERGASVITAKVPVAEMFGFDSALKSATSGHGFYSLIDVLFERIPRDLQDKAVLVIRKRKGMTEEIPKPEN
ncbi:MAG: elongation factor EF-2 [Candidatus Aenigmatarchaeota archaeon]